MHMHTHTQTHTTILRPFFGTILVSWCQKKASSGLHGARRDIRGRHTNNPAGRHSIWTNHRPTSLIPSFSCQMPFLPQPSQFILALDRHQICWLAYLDYWLGYVMLFITACIIAHCMLCRLVSELEWWQLTCQFSTWWLTTFCKCSQLQHWCFTLRQCHRFRNQQQCPYNKRRW